MDAKHQFKYTYNETDLEDHSPVEVTFDMPGDVTLTQMLWNFECYLKAAGFYFDGHLEIVDHTFDVMKDQDDIDEIYGCMADWDKDEEESSCCGGGCGCEDEERDKAEKNLKEWNESIAKLDKEVKKNNWVHGICNPPSPDWKAQNKNK